MNIRDLRYLIALGKHKHFGKAAKACHVSQPSLSIQIKKLEEFWGVQLLERTNKQVLITEIGHVVIEKAQKIVDELDELKDYCESINNPLSGTLRVGIIPTIAPYVLPQILLHLKHTYPQLNIHPYESQTHIITDELAMGNLDLLILALPVNTQNCQETLLANEPFLLAVNKQHPLAERPYLQQTDLDGETVMLLEEGHCFRDQALELCQKMNAAEHLDMRATSLETLKHMVSLNLGITLVPYSSIDTNIDNIRYIPFNKPIPFRKIGLLWRNTSPKRNLLGNIAVELKALFEEITQPNH